jgi:DNA-binding transcriptional regulator YiaG
MTGSEFRTLRQHCHLSLRALGTLWRLSHMTLWKWETGRRKVNPAYATLLLLMAHAVRRCPHCQGTGIQRR